MRITLESARGIFRPTPVPPQQVWERQFDGNDAALKRLARTTWESIRHRDLGEYFLDLTFVDELQDDLFRYLFPACLMYWHESLQRNESCEGGGTDFHLALHRGRILDRMLTPAQRDRVGHFFLDSFLDRLDAERLDPTCPESAKAYGWIGRWNSLAMVTPLTATLWDAWWSLGSPGHAWAALEYVSLLMYFRWENPLFPSAADKPGMNTPSLFDDDSYIFLDRVGWLPENAAFLRRQVTVDYLAERIAAAAGLLAGEPEAELARRVADDFGERAPTVEDRLAELPVQLSEGDGDDESW
jgi:hypothetical protein